MLTHDQLPEEHNMLICNICRSLDIKHIKDPVCKIHFKHCNKCDWCDSLDKNLPTFKPIKVIGFPNNCGFKLIT
mgnify:CR=1 FL=1